MEKRESSGFSFTFSKKVNIPKVDKSKLLHEDDKSVQETEYIHLLEEQEIRSTQVKDQEIDLIIPLIRRNVWRLPKNKVSSEDLPTNRPLTLDEQALQEIIQDGKHSKEEKKASNDSFVIPLLMQNKVPEGFETDDKLDVSLRPDPSALDDYEKFPVEQFGLAALRGMGWKPGGGIGRTNRRCVAPVEVTVRPRGLGLGASSKDLESLKAQTANQEEFPLVVGALICVVEGNSKGQYGEIQSLDEETGRVIVKLCQSESLVTVPEVFLKGVSKEEFKKESKKERGDKRKHSRENDLLDKRKHRRENKAKKKNKRDSSPEGVWLHPHLRMRIIDHQYKKGRFFKSKVLIEDVTTPTTCVCQTEDGNILEGVESKMLETVIPKSGSNHVMVIQGQFRGKIGSILGREREKCLATVHLLTDKVIQLSYDSICEFVGDPSIYE